MLFPQKLLRKSHSEAIALSEIEEPIRAELFSSERLEQHAESLAAAQAKMAATEVNTRWQQFMAPYFDSNARPDENFLELEEVFHLD